MGDFLRRFKWNKEKELNSLFKMNIQTILSLSNELDKFLSNKENVIVFYKLLKTECLHNQNLINCLKSDVGQKDIAIIEIIL